MAIFLPPETTVPAFAGTVVVFPKWRRSFFSDRVAAHSSKRPYFFFAAFFLVAFFLLAFFALAAMINLHVGLVPGRVFTESKKQMQERVHEILTWRWAARTAVGRSPTSFMHAARE
jgi:TRAP-type mannitol/chloroaromatic compound transport system permease small subunit